MTFKINSSIEELIVISDKVLKTTVLDALACMELNEFYHFKNMLSRHLKTKKGKDDLMIRALYNAVKIYELDHIEKEDRK